MSIPPRVRKTLVSNNNNFSFSHSWHSIFFISSLLRSVERKLMTKTTNRHQYTVVDRYHRCTVTIARYTKPARLWYCTAIRKYLIFKHTKSTTGVVWYSFIYYLIHQYKYASTSSLPNVLKPMVPRIIMIPS